MKARRNDRGGNGRRRSDPRERRSPQRLAILGVSLALGAALLVIAGLWVSGRFGSFAPPPARSAPATKPDFVGATTCAGCHGQQYEDWQPSHHALAMLEADEQSVLGDFNNATFTYAGVTSTFFRRDGDFMVRTDGPDGRLADFRIGYTFGVEPLQQYLISLGAGRLQALSIAWDARSRAQGGQRWFHLYPEERITHTDELHWTGRQQNWNFMCVDCHSTNLRKNYDPQADRFETTWSEINVACEACHGPGSDHVAWAEGARSGSPSESGDKGLTVMFSTPRRWSIDPATGRPTRIGPRSGDAELTVCAQCHALRQQFSDGYHAGKPLLDYYLPELLTPEMYHSDGQQQGEVFTYGSFLQSKMYQAGVTCSNCHEPHSGALRTSGNQLCGQCHTPKVYDAESHHFHPAGSTGAACVSCHMPATLYMIVDPRRDHSFPIPRPDLSVALGVPNPCSGCHADRTAEWAAERVGAWYGRTPTGFKRFAEAFHADEHNRAAAAEALIAIAEDLSHPGMVRASALERLAGRPSTAAIEAARMGLADPDPLVRRAALSVVESLPVGSRASLAATALNDPTRAVRLQAARALAPERGRLTTPTLQLAFQRGADEFIASRRFLADRAESRTELGAFFAQLGRAGDAEAEYRAALAILPGYVPAYINLADLYRAQGREAEAEHTLRTGLAAAPANALLHHALALSLARAGRVEEALKELERATALAPDDPRIVYTYAVALHSAGRIGSAIQILEEALTRHRGNRDMLFALATFNRDAGNRAQALHYADLLLELDPADPQAQMLRQSLASGSAP